MQYSVILPWASLPSFGINSLQFSAFPTGTSLPTQFCAGYATAGNTGGLSKSMNSCLMWYWWCGSRLGCWVLDLCGGESKSTDNALLNIIVSIIDNFKARINKCGVQSGAQDSSVGNTLALVPHANNGAGAWSSEVITE